MPALPSDYQALTNELMRLAATVGQPASGTFELTSRCNLDCRMCYVRCPAGNAAARATELSAAEWVFLAREAVEQGMLFLLLTGGEIFLRPDFFAIYEPLTALGLNLTLFTNGTLITEEIARRLAVAPPNRLEITLYGATPETYEAVTRVSGSYKRCLRGIERLLNARVPLALKSTLSKLNISEVEAMRQMAQTWGVPFTGDPFLNKRRDGEQSPLEEIRLTAAECIDFEMRDPLSAQAWCKMAGSAPKGEEKPFYCDAGKNSFVIGPSGEMNVCISLPLPGVSPREIGFHNAWRHVQNFLTAVPPATACRDCAAHGFCPRCPAWSFTETGVLTEKVPYLCGLAEERRRRYQGERTA